MHSNPPRQSWLILGCGYVGSRLLAALADSSARIVATARSEAQALRLTALGVEAHLCDDPTQLPATLLAECDSLLDSIPLQAGERAGQCDWLPLLAPRMSRLGWAAYLSATSVYGDAGGDWVDETHPCRPSSRRGSERLRAEAAWLHSGLPAEIFRLAGIYGPGRNILGRLRAGNYPVIDWQPPHFSSRIHVDDIVAALLAARCNPRPGRMVNLADDLPLPHADYAAELATAIGAPPPMRLTPAEAEQRLSPAMLDFFRDNKRIDNRRLHAELLPQLRYASFRTALPDLLAAEQC